MAIKPIEILIRAKDEFSGMLGSMQAKVAAAAVAIAGFFGITLFSGAVKSAAEFEAAMSRVKAAAGGTDQEFKALKQAAEDAGAATKYTSVQAAEALENLAKAGLNATQAIEALPAVLALAQAGDVDLGTSAEFVTKAVMGMGLAFSDAGRVADVLALGANATNTSVKGLAEALSYAAPTAQSLGLSLETTVAIIGKFADAGIDASRAGTALNSVMSQFSDPASKFRNELAAIGITTGDFNKALHALAASGDRGQKAINAVGMEAGPALKALLNQGMPALDELKAKLDNAAGSAAATAATMEDNLTGGMNSLASAWDTVKNVLGAPVLPALKDGVDQLSGALRGLVSDGTIAKFGESLAEAFRAGIKWARDFFEQIDFKAAVASMQEFAAQAGDTFRSIGEHAAMAGNAAQAAYGVMSAGANAVMAVVYLVGEAFAGVASNIQSGVAIILEGLAKISFGGVSASFKQAAAEIRLSAEATWAASEALGKKSTEAFIDMADNAQTARDGFAGLAKSATDAKPTIDQSSKAIADMATELQKAAEANATAKKATEEKAAVDQAAKLAVGENRAAVALLREEYAALVASGNLQGAAEKLKEINLALQGTVPAAKDAAKAAADAAAQIDAAFTRLGVTSSAALKDQAANAQRDYDTIKNAGTSTAQDIGAAFKVAAEKAITANNGIAPSWVEAQAAMRGYKVEVDATGKAVVTAMEGAQRAVSGISSAHGAATGAAQQHTGAVRDLGAAYTDAGAKALAAQGQFLAAAAAQKSADTSASSITNRPASQNQFAWTRLAIVDWLKQAGLDEDTAKKVSGEFVDSNGDVPYINNGGQIKYAGKNSTLTQALSKAAEEHIFSNKKDASTPAPAPPPGGIGGTGGNTYVNNITINGVGDWGVIKGTTRHTDAQSAQTEEQLLRQLAQAKSTST